MMLFILLIWLILYWFYSTTYLISSFFSYKLFCSSCSFLSLSYLNLDIWVKLLFFYSSSSLSRSIIRFLSSWICLDIDLFVYSNLFMWVFLEFSSSMRKCFSVSWRFISEIWSFRVFICLVFYSMFLSL